MLGIPLIKFRARIPTAAPRRKRKRVAAALRAVPARFRRVRLRRRRGGVQRPFPLLAFVVVLAIAALLCVLVFGVASGTLSFH